MKADYLPETWTGCEIIGEAVDADAVAERLSKSLHPVGWFADLDTETHNYLVFPGQVMKYARKGTRGITGQPWPQAAKAAARLARIPGF